MVRSILPILLLAASLSATVPAPVHFTLKMDPAPEGAAMPDTAKLVAALQAFVQREGLQEPASGGDGWALGIRVVPVIAPKGVTVNPPKSQEGFQVAKVFLRLSTLRGGQIQDKDSKEDAGVFAADGTQNLDQAIIESIRTLLSDQRLVETTPTMTAGAWKKIGTRTGSELVEFDGDRVQVPIKYTAEVLKALAAVDQQWRRFRIDEEVTTDTDGRPLFVIGRNAQESVLITSTVWMTSSTFKPESVDGTPVRAHFLLRLMSVGPHSFHPR